MDVTSIAVTLMTARSQSMAESVAARLIRNNLDSEKQVAELLTASGNQIDGAATAAAHLGTNLDVSV